MSISLRGTPPGLVSVTMAGLLTCGSTLARSFPGPSSLGRTQWSLSGSLTAYSCGGSHGFGQGRKRPAPYSLFIPSACRRPGTIGAIERRWGDQVKDQIAADRRLVAVPSQRHGAIHTAAYFSINPSIDKSRKSSKAARNSACDQSHQAIPNNASSCCAVARRRMGVAGTPPTIV